MFDVQVVCLGVTYDDMPDQSVLLILLLTFAIFMWFFRYACSFIEYAVFPQLYVTFKLQVLIPFDACVIFETKMYRFFF